MPETIQPPETKPEIPTKTGSCHCGAIRFTLIFPPTYPWEKVRTSISRCDCTLCRRKGAIMLSIPIVNFTLTHGAENLALYQWNTLTAKHYFCKTCGIYTHHQRRTSPDHYGINLGCLNHPEAQTSLYDPEIKTFTGNTLSTM